MHRYLFAQTIFSVFAEDSRVPAAVVDVVVPLMRNTEDSDASQGSFRRQGRKRIKQLLKSHLLLGDLDSLSVHDLVVCAHTLGPRRNLSPVAALVAY